MSTDMIDNEVFTTRILGSDIQEGLTTAATSWAQRCVSALRSEDFEEALTCSKETLRLVELLADINPYSAYGLHQM